MTRIIESCFVCGQPVDLDKTYFCAKCGHDLDNPKECRCPGCEADKIDAAYERYKDEQFCQ